MHRQFRRNSQASNGKGSAGLNRVGKWGIGFPLSPPLFNPCPFNFNLISQARPNPNPLEFPCFPLRLLSSQYFSEKQRQAGQCRSGSGLW